MNQIFLTHISVLVIICVTTQVVVEGLSDVEWVMDETKQKIALGRSLHNVTRFTLNLDLAPKDRWTHIVSQYKWAVPAILAYLETAIPAWAMPIVAAIGADIQPYFTDYGDEMTGIADAMGMAVGDVVAVNLVYQLESIGLNCSNWNNTGPTVKDDPGCMAVDPSQDWCYCKNATDHINPVTGVLPPPKYQMPNTGPGLCTSVVAQHVNGDYIIHGRNLDWNIPDILRKLVIDVEYQRNNKTVFIGTTIASFVGVINGMKAGSEGWSVSMNARGKGGKIWKNLLQALLHKSMTPSQHMRQVLESGCGYANSIKQLATKELVDEAYFTVAGATPGQGAVITRNRNASDDIWELNLTQADNKGWYRLETNYDHWKPAPVADNRRTPGYNSMDAMGQDGISINALKTIMTTWPVYNHHTDYTGIYIPFNGTYVSQVWLDDEANM